MKKLIAGLFLVFLFASCSNESNHGDKYELITSNSRTFLVDKTNGTVWLLILSTDGKWRNLGAPSIDAPEKGDESSF